MAMLLKDEDMSVEWLRAVHELLCKGDPAAEPGSLRTTEVRVGNRRCPAATDVPRLVDEYCRVVNRIVRMCLANELPSVEAAAAAIMLGLTEVHPFRDGNGRLSRIVCNWLLAKCAGIPYAVSLCATDEHRSAYIQAVVLAFTPGMHARGLEAVAQLVRQSLLRSWEELDRLRSRLEDDAKASAAASAVQQARQEKQQDCCMVCYSDSSCPVTTSFAITSSTQILLIFLCSAFVALTLIHSFRVNVFLLADL